MKRIEELQKIQNRCGYLPLAELKKLPYSLSDTIGVASFYEHFRFQSGEVKDCIENIYPLQKSDALLSMDENDLKAAISKAKDADVIALLKASGLRGRGGSGFPCWMKWELVRSSDEKEKYVVCNADEGEPGTGKDRVILEKSPETVIAGMAICAAATGAKKGFIYLRGEYADLKPLLEKAIENAQLDGFSLDLRTGMGAYVCGEETALLESLEGKRGEPRLKPPLPGVSGLLGKPTVINNVETFACVPLILLRGADYFRRRGTEKYPGTKLYTVSGCVKYPGVYETDAGITASALLEAAGGLCEGASLQAIHIGGGSGSILSPDFLEISLSPEGCAEYDAALGTGSVRFISVEEDLGSYVAGLADFFSRESCGTCVPCRLGLRQLVSMLEDPETSKERILELATYIRGNSRCGLGQTAVVPVLSWLKGWCSL